MIKTKPIRYDYNYLQQHCKENGIYLMEDYSKKKLNRDTIIKASCLTENCNYICEKNFRQIQQTGSYCKICTEKLRQEKIKQTTYTRYKVSHNSQLQEIKNKKKETCFKNHGVENPSHSKEIIAKIQETTFKNHGVKHALQNKEILEKFKNTNLLNLGVEFPTQSEAVREKVKKTNLLNWDVENVSQNEEIKEKKEETCFKNYGVKNPSQSEEILKKQKETMMNNLGVEHALQSEEIRNKIKNDCISKHGVPYFMQVPEIAQKCFDNSFKTHQYLLPSGKTVNYQGYENYVWDELLETLNETDIISGCMNVPNIEYLDENNKLHKHYVDFFIPSKNKCIECKSTYTLTLGIKKDNIFIKQNAGKALGYEYEIWVYNGKGKKVECYR